MIDRPLPNDTSRPVLQPSRLKQRSPRRARWRAVRHRLLAIVARIGTAAMVRLGPRVSAGLLAAFCRLVGPRSEKQRLAEENLRIAFPRMGEAERKKVLRGMWDNVGRTIGEFVHVERLVPGSPGPESARITLAEVNDYLASGDRRISVTGAEHFLTLRDDGKPAIIFSAHLANWELLAVVAARFGLPVTALFEPPTNLEFAEELIRRRSGMMGGLVAAQRGAALELAAALEAGSHVGLLVDQRKNHGPQIPLFGRPAATNDTAAKLARAFDCPVHGARAIRLPGGRFHLEMTPPVDLPRDGEGRIDVTGAIRTMTAIVEGWIAEHPEQWLWLYDRWGLKQKAPRVRRGRA